MSNTKSQKLYPKVFIGSSSEGLSAAKALLACLEEEQVDAVLWKDAGFGLSTTPIESLEAILTDYSFGVFIFTKDDQVVFRNEEMNVPRDNVVFELGLWLGHWGRSNCAIVSEKGSDLKLPSDLSGLIAGEVELPPDKDPQKTIMSMRSVALKVAAACFDSAKKNRLQVPAIWLWQRLIDSELPLVIAVACPQLLRARIVGDGPAAATVNNEQYVMSGQYTGLGETEAAGRIFDITSSLGGHRFPMVFPSSDVPDSRLRSPLILLGGYYSNLLSESLLTDKTLPIQMSREGIRVDDKEYKPSVNGRIVTDYAVTLWRSNPYNPEQRLLLSAGYHSCGTVGGIEYLTHSSGTVPDLSSGGVENFMMVFCVRTVGSNREFPKLLEVKTW